METLSFILADKRYEYPCFELVQQFMPEIKVIFNEESDHRIIVDLMENDLIFTALVKGQILLTQHYMVKESPLDKNTFKGFLYVFFTKLFGKTLDWGMMTGIKPVKWAHAFLRSGMNRHETETALQEKFYLSDEKSQLITDIAEREIPFIYPLEKKRVSIYVGIPLCIAKCSYCSFVSTITDKKGELAATYIHHLLREIALTGQWMKKTGLRVDTLYIGGGTPSVLTAKQLECLLKALKESFDLSYLREYTFEAGRPETTDAEKLQLLKQYGVDRICLNPQSMNADTLMAVNRRHTPEAIIKTYDLIREAGFDNVNMDLILGLNHESEAAFIKSLETVMALRPENITVHCLSLKKGSAMKEVRGRSVENLYSPAFCDQIRTYLAEKGYTPYYLYRQKYTQGNGENIGYCLDGKEGIYNMLMMAEKQSIIGIGAGSSGKLYTPETDRFDKIFTVKDIRTYNARADEMIERKLKAYQAFFSV